MSSPATGSTRESSLKRQYEFLSDKLPTDEHNSINRGEKRIKLDNREGTKLKYDPLDETRQEIRLLTILPAVKGTQHIRCELTHISIENPVSYTALSYCWGSSEETRSIEVNGFVFLATLNLEAALREFRRRGYDRVWIDAVCINQEDKIERAHQILRMRQIYATATETIAWLGPDDKMHAITTFAHLRVLARMVSETKLKEAIRTASELLESYPPQEWIAYVAFLALPYWQRTWILQEIVVSSRLNLWWGSVSCPVEHLITSMNTLLEHRTAIRILAERKGFQNVLGLTYLAEQYNSSSGCRLITALTYSCASLATDPKDKIFGLLGLCTDGPELMPSPDYRQSLEGILVDITSAMIVDVRAKNEPMDLICLRNPVNSHDSNLPSWVIDWPSYWSKDRGNVWSSRTERGLSFEYRSTLTSQKVVRFIDDGRTFITQGWQFDIIDTLSHSPSATSSTTTSSSNSNQGATTRKSIYGSVENTFDAIWRTLVMDRTDDLNITAPVEYGLHFSQLWTADMESVMHSHRSSSFVSKILIIGSFLIYGRPLKLWAKFMRPQMVALHGQKGKIPMSGMSKEQNLKLEEDLGMLEGFIYAIKLDEMNRRFMTTRKGYIGMAHPLSRVGDLICLLPGCTVPVILRTCRGGHSIVGEAYVHGVMNGEAWKARDKDTMEEFCIR